MKESKALVIKVKGEVQSSNMAEFEADARKFLDGINTKLKTDQDFGEAKENVKSCKEKEINIANGLQGALMSMDEIAKVITCGEKVSSDIRDKRLMLEKLVKTEETARKLEITNNGIAEVQEHLTSSPVKNGYVFDKSKIVAAIKGKKSLSKMEEAVEEVVEGMIADIDILVATFNQNIGAIDEALKEYPGLFPDKETQALNPVENVSLLISSRINEFKVKQAEKIEAERLAKECLSSMVDKVKSQEEKPVADITSHRGMVIEADIVKNKPTLAPNPFLDEPKDEISDEDFEKLKENIVNSYNIYRGYQDQFRGLTSKDHEWLK